MASRSSDLTVRSHSQTFLTGQSSRPSHRLQPVRCQSYCCSPLRPQLVRRTASESSLSSSHSDKSLHDIGTDGQSNEQSDDGSTPDFGDLVDMTTFEQILEMDDDEEEREFSKSIVYDFFTQADSTFTKMHSNLEKKDLPQLSALGHFLKGSSATLGLTKVKDSCEKIQHYGAMKDETGTHDETDKEKCLTNCKKTIEQAQKEFKEVEKLLRKFYHDDGSG